MGRRVKLPTPRVREPVTEADVSHVVIEYDGETTGVRYVRAAYGFVVEDGTVDGGMHQIDLKDEPVLREATEAYLDAVAQALLRRGV